MPTAFLANPGVHGRIQKTSEGQFSQLALLFETVKIYSVYWIGLNGTKRNHLRMKNVNGKSKQVSFGRVEYSEQRERFLKVELDLAITFCQTGLAMLNRTRAERSAKNARKALDTVERMFPTMILTEVVQKQISEKIVRATCLLSKLKYRLENA